MFEKCIKKYGDTAYPIFRIVIGLLIALHGAQKFGIIGEGTVAGFAGLFGLPVWVGFIVAFIELVGGLAILFGLFTRPAAFFAGIEMLVALLFYHLPNGLNPLTNGGELALLFLVSFLVIYIQGAKKWSLEKKLFKKEKF